ncbi:putative ubx domain-containing protein [Phaeomoniella chlamydospora]|uniref:Putative ubx domain-containing protein n=1 Tax=Phaeomoniella chlamydospora TaxID=158046 RepID=A0A0G2F448_PHACM|nr:putative ubx domain-containing protein [Phaeomoniella chlamydospora]
MASHVVVIDSTARRATVKTTPAKPLSDILEEACKKLNLNPNQYGLKNNNKPVDLSRTIRLSGLSSGAKLELVQLSKSPSVVSVALQLPESAAQGLPNGRLTDKFPSTTTLWHVLRKFEAGVAGGGGASGKNLTARSVPVIQQGGSGEGALYYEQPCINIMGRELSTFTDLQKTLGQLGFNSGSTLLRLNFKTTETPMHEAMEQITEYFKSLEDDFRPPPSQPATTSEPPPSNEAATTSTPREPTEAGNDTPMTDAPSTDSTIPDQPPSTPPSPSLTSRPVQIFAAPTSSTPSAASFTTHNASDYVPTVEHAQAHQRLLQQSSRNVRLPTDSELEAQAQAAREKLASVASIEIKIRFPDQTSIVATFAQSDTAKELYNFVRECLDPSVQSEPFVLKYPNTSTGPLAASRPGGQSTVPVTPLSDSTTSPSSHPKLIQDLALKGRTLMTFFWDPEKTSPEARMKRTVLKPELRSEAKEIEVKDIGATSKDKDEDKGVRVDLSGKGADDGKEGKDGRGAKKVPKWLKLPGKK